MEKIRVMRIITRMNLGGPAIQIMGLLKGFAASEYDHRLYTGECAPNEIDFLELNSHDLNVIRVRKMSRDIRIIKDLESLFFLVLEIRRFKPHIIHTHTTKAGVLGRIASIISMHKSIRIHTFHGHILTGYIEGWLLKLVINVERILAKFSHYLIAVGEKVKNDLLKNKIGEISRFCVIYPGLQINTLPEKKYAQDILELNSDLLQIAFIGRVEQIKRPDRFLDVVSKVKDRKLNVQFFLAGDGELLDYCRKRVSAEDLPVKFLGWQNNIEVILAAADIVILSSDNEGSPLTLIQAGMGGLPVVATNVGSISEIVSDGKTGFVTDIDVDQLTDALEKLINDSNLRSRFGIAARELALSRFGVNRMVSDHNNLYKRFVN